MVFETHLHRILYIWPILQILLASFFAIAAAKSAHVRYVPHDSAILQGQILAVLAVVIFVHGAFVLLNRMGRRATSEFVVTNKRVVIKTGFISRKTIEIVLNKVESIDVRQTVWGRIFNFGQVMVIGTGGSREKFNLIANPIDFRHAVQNQQAI